MALENPFQSNDGSYKVTHKINGIVALHDWVIVKDMNFGNRTLSSGLIMLSDDAKTAGIRPRWAQVYRVGPNQKNITEGQWIMIEHGRWTRGAKVEVEGEEFTIRRVDPSAIIFVSDTEPGTDDNISTAVYAERKER